MNSRSSRALLLDDCDFARLRCEFSLTLQLLLQCTRLVLHAFKCSVRLVAVATLLVAYCQSLQVIYVHVSATLYGLRCVSLPQYSVRTCGRGHACMPVMSIHSWTGVCAVLSFESTCPVCVVQITPSSAAVSTQLLMFFRMLRFFDAAF